MASWVAPQNGVEGSGVRRTGRQTLLYDQARCGPCDALHGLLWSYHIWPHQPQLRLPSEGGPLEIKQDAQHILHFAHRLC
jgi:hypothetical protein